MHIIDKVYVAVQRKEVNGIKAMPSVAPSRLPAASALGRSDHGSPRDLTNMDDVKPIVRRRNQNFCEVMKELEPFSHQQALLTEVSARCGCLAQEVLRRTSTRNLLGFWKAINKAVA